DGTGITKAEVNKEGDLIIDYTDGRHENAGHVSGEGGSGSWDISVNGKTATVDKDNNTVALNDGKNIEIKETAERKYSFNVSETPEFTRVDVKGDENNIGIDNGGNRIINVADGVENSDAANIGQLSAVSADVADNSTKITNIAGDVSNNSTRINNIALDVTKNSTNIEAISKDMSLVVKYDGAGKETITLGGENGTQIKNVAAGTEATDAANVGQLDQLKAKGQDYAGDAGDKIHRDLGSQLNIKGGATSVSAADNIGVISDGNDTLNIRLAKDITGIDSVSVNKTISVAGGTTITKEGLVSNAIKISTASGDVIINNGGVSMGGNRITNIAPGANATDAATVGQLSETTDNLYRVYSELSDEVEDLGAESAALAGLKPIQYDPLEPTQIMAAVGNYRGSTAIAVGLAHYTRENTMFHIGASYGGSSRVLANAGVTFRLGGKKDAIPARYKAGPISATYVMQDEISALKAENAKLKESNEKMQA
ncbi:YadA C-terminal domain-containing protein, partial [Synergistes jonesii]|uniref:YadA C-terminal domain-containing protein n=1 Tax=Synergistes jonesii TaxID=2754 RepID=UPI000AEA4EE9